MVSTARFTLIQIAFFLFFLLTFTAHANVTVQGRVVDEADVPLPGVSVLLLDTAGETLGIGASTDLDGGYRLAVPATLAGRMATPTSATQPVMMQLRFTHLGYQPQSLTLSTGGNSEIEVATVTMVPRYATLHDVTLTAARFGENGRNTYWPETRSTLRGVEIEAGTPRAAAEILRDDPAISVQKTSHGGGSAVIRGLDANRIVLAVDGIRLNNSAYRLGNHPYLNLVDPYTLDHVNVLQGPGSVRFGSDALGGAVNLLTRDPELAEQGTQLQLRGVGRVGSADRERTGHAGFSWANPVMSLLGSASFTRLGDLRRGEWAGDERLDVYTDNAVQSPTGFDQHNLNLKYRLQPTPRTNMVAAWQQSYRTDIPRYDKHELDGDYVWQYDPQRRDLAYLRWEQNWARKRVLMTETRLWWQRQEEGRVTQETPGDLRTEELDVVQTLGASVQGSAALETHYLVAGIDFYGDEISSERRFITPSNQVTSAARGRYPDGSTYLTAGGFLRHHWAVSPRLRVSSGLRLEHNRASFELPVDGGLGGDYEQAFQSIAGQLGVLWFLDGAGVDPLGGEEATQGRFIRLNGSHGYRAPNLSDLARLGESRGDNYEVPNPDLTAETATSMELGFGWGGEGWRFEATGHNTRLRDLIGRGPSTWNGSDSITVGDQTWEVWSRLNQGRGWIRGVEARGDLFVDQARRWELRAAAAKLWSENEETGDPLENVPPLMGRAGVVRHWGHGASVELFGRFAAEKDDLSPDEVDDPRVPPGGTPGWWTLNLRGRYDFALSPNVPAGLRLSLENLFDKHYREHNSGVSAPGFHAVVELEVRWNG